MNGDFVIAAGEADVAESDQRVCLLRVTHHVFALRRGEDVGKQLQAHLMIVLHDLGLGVHQVLCHQVADNADFKQLPVTV